MPPEAYVEQTLCAVIPVPILNHTLFQTPFAAFFTAGGLIVDLPSDKKTLRRYYSGLRNALSDAERSEASRKICEAIRSLDEYGKAECVAAFSALGAEPDLSLLFSEKRLFLPRFNAEKEVYEMVYVSDTARDLVVGKYGIAEPRRELEAAGENWCRENLLYLVPAVACDSQGVRLGRGGGYYDRLLENCRMPAIGVIFDCQLAERLPAEEHDIRLAMAVTEKRFLKFGSGTVPEKKN